MSLSTVVADVSLTVTPAFLALETASLSFVVVGTSVLNVASFETSTFSVVFTGATCVVFVVVVEGVTSSAEAFAAPNAKSKAAAKIAPHKLRYFLDLRTV